MLIYATLLDRQTARRINQSRRVHARVLPFCLGPVNGQQRETALNANDPIPVLILYVRQCTLDILSH